MEMEGRKEGGREEGEDRFGKAGLPGPGVKFLATA